MNMRFARPGALCAFSFLLVVGVSELAIAQSDHASSSFAAQAPVVDQSGRREWVWEGGDSLTVAGSGSVRYEAGGTPRIIVTGDPEAVANVEVDGGFVRKRDGSLPQEKKVNLNILVQGAALNRFDLLGSATMDLGRLQRDQLALTINGSGVINLQGQAAKFSLQVNGSGQANLDQLSSNDANITINGSGHAKAGNIAGHADIRTTGSGSAIVGAVANGADVRVTGSGKTTLGPAETIDVNVVGSGTVELSSMPIHPIYHVVGSGKVRLVGSDGKTTELARMQPVRTHKISNLPGVEVPRQSR
jgi:hypothetical protein